MKLGDAVCILTILYDSHPIKKILEKLVKSRLRKRILSAAVLFSTQFAFKAVKFTKKAVMKVFTKKFFPFTGYPLWIWSMFCELVEDQRNMIKPGVPQGFILHQDLDKLDKPEESLPDELLKWFKSDLASPCVSHFG